MLTAALSSSAALCAQAVTQVRARSELEEELLASRDENTALREMVAQLKSHMRTVATSPEQLVPGIVTDAVPGVVPGAVPVGSPVPQHVIPAVSMDGLDEGPGFDYSSCPERLRQVPQ